jgi:AcrR family transcriptional regulator
MWTIPPSPRPYRHGNLPNALRAAVREILDEGGGEGVLLSEAARRVGVTSAAAYRHFRDKEGLLASVATEGFRELAAAMEEAAAGTDQLTGAGLAYVKFALQKRGLFRMMFGPILAERRNIPSSPPPLTSFSAWPPASRGHSRKTRQPSRRGAWSTDYRFFLSTAWSPRRGQEVWRKK